MQKFIKRLLIIAAVIVVVFIVIIAIWMLSDYAGFKAWLVE